MQKPEEIATYAYKKMNTFNSNAKTYDYINRTSNDQTAYCLNSIIHSLLQSCTKLNIAKTIRHIKNRNLTVSSEYLKIYQQVFLID